jgi:hypothetical protein|tara:strand:+ start:908 stop:1768 length:861 start_codon:yes stop_codon:yes gene_type:complete
MPLDIITQQSNIEDTPLNLNFSVQFEPTKVRDKKYVINGDTGEYIGVVGDSFNCASHDDFFQGVQHTMCENLSEHEMSGAKVTWRNARHEAWALMDVTLPNVTSKIVTPKHETEVAQRIIALHGIDGSCSNMVFFGAIDFFCTNGMIRGEHDKVRRKNTSNFSMDRFIDDLRDSKQDFYAQSERLQRWANIDLTTVNVKDLLDSILKSDRKSEKMFTLYNQEVANRGRNVFSLYSAFTNYASYADERNGFNLRNTGNDTQAVSMFQREHQVSQWIASKPFEALVAA